MKLNIAYDKTATTLDGSPGQFQTLVSCRYVPSRLGLGLLPGIFGDKQPNLIEVQLVKGLVSNDQMTEMRRVERSP